MLVRLRPANLVLFVVLFLSAAVQPSRASAGSPPAATGIPTAAVTPTVASSTAANASTTVTPPISVSATAPASTTGTPLVTATATSPTTATTTSIASSTPPTSETTRPLTGTTPTPSTATGTLAATMPLSSPLSTTTPTTTGISTPMSGILTPLTATTPATSDSPLTATPSSVSDLLPSSPTTTTTSVSTTQAISSYGNLPLQFEPNQGQTDSRVGFLSRGPGYTLFLTSAGATLAFVQRPPRASHRPGHPVPSSGRSTHADLLGNGADSITSTTPQTESVIRLGFAGAALNAHPTLTGEDPLPGRVNYFQGKQSDGGWHTNIPTYGRVTYHDVYPGIDVVYYGTQGHTLEYDWRVAPGVDPTAIRMDVEGAQSTTVDGQGALVLHTVLGDVQQRTPMVYQDVDGRRVDIPTHYSLTGEHQVGFAVGAHDAHRPLVIDPVLVYSTYLGGSGGNDGYGIAVDSVGAAYVTGDTASTSFPTTTGAFATTSAGGYDAFVTKLNVSGAALVYSTYLGGNGADSGNGIAVDGAGDAYVTGNTDSSDFPTTTGAFSTTYGGGSDAFVVKLNASGSALLYGAYLGGSGQDSGNGIVVDGTGAAYVTGLTYSTNFPTTTGAFSTTYGGGGDDAFAAKLNSTGSALLYSTYLSGSGYDEGYGIAVDGAGAASISGYTTSPNFPTTTGAFATTYSGGGNGEAFVTRLTASGNALLYSTYLGGSGGDIAYGVAVDGVGAAYVTGNTYSSDFPTTPGAFSTTYSGGGNNEPFVTKLTASGSALLYSTYLGGSGGGGGSGIAVDGAGAAYVTGYTDSADFPTTPGVFTTYGGNGRDDAFVTKLSASGGALPYATYLGGSGVDDGAGIAVDGAGAAYVTGYTNSTDFPTTTGAFSTTYRGDGNTFDAFVAKFAGFPSSPTATAQGGIVPWHPHRTVRLADGLSASVDLANGHLDLTAADVNLPALGPDLSIAHTWDSQAAQAGSTTTAGQGWNTELTASMGGVLTETVVFTDATGAHYPFVYLGGPADTSPFTSYAPAPGQPWTLTATADGSGTTGYTLTDFLTGETMSFDGQGRVVATADAYGNANTLPYTGGPGPSSMTNSGGRSLQFLYNGSGLLSESKSPLWVSGGSGQAGSQHVTYGYQPGTTQLITMTLAASTSAPLSTIFGYTGPLLTSVKTPYTPATHRWSIGYDALGRVTAITSPVAVATQPVVTRFTYNTGPGQTIVTAGYGTSAALPLTYTLDTQGEPISITDALGHATAYQYDGDHDITSTTDARGNTTTNHHAYVGAAGRVGLLTETDAPSIVAYAPGGATLPVTTTYRYDPTTYDLLERDSAEGGRSVYTYDGTRHRVTAAMDALGPTLPVGCQATQMARAARAAGRTGTAAMLVVRPADSGPCAPTGAHWRGTIYAYDARGQLVAATDGRGVYVGDTTGGQTPTASLNPTPPVAATRSYTYTPAGDLLSASSPPITTLKPTGTGQTTGPVTTVYGYDADGNRTSVTSPNGYRTTLSYDHLGRLSQAAQPSIKLWDGSTHAPTATIGYDGDGNVVRTTDGAGDPTTRAYDALGRLLSSKNAINETTVFTYTATWLAQASTPAGNTTSYRYDLAGRPSGTTDPMGTLTQYGLDAVGNTVALTVPLGAPGASSVEARTYDGLNQLSTDTVGGTGELSPTLSQTTSSFYDRDGNLVQQQAPNGDVTYRSYDFADRPRAVTVYPGAQSGPPGSLPLADSQTFALDDADNLIDQLDFNQRDHASTFDGDSRVTQRVDSYVGQAQGQAPGAITTLSGYDPDGNVRTLSRSVSGVAGTQAYTATYNAADWPLTGDDGQGATAYGYDAAGRLHTQSLLGGTGAVTATLNPEGLATRINESVTRATSLFGYTPDDLPYTATLDAAGGAIAQTWGYNRNDRVVSLSEIGPSGSGYRTQRAYAYGRLPQGWVQAITTTLNSNTTTQAFGYDASDRLTGEFRNNGGSPTVPYTQTYDGNGNVTSRVDLVDPYPNLVTYNYTPTSGLTSSTWLPNELVNTAVTYERPSSGIVSSWYSYDASGDTTQITSTGAITTLTYDASGHFTGATFAGGGGAPLTVSVGYNARGLRASEVFSGGGQPAMGETFVYRGDRVGQVVVTGTAPFTETFVYRQDGAPLELLYQAPGQALARYWYLTDGQGNVVALDDANGVEVNNYFYNAWGVPLNTIAASSMETIPQPLRFKGYWYDGWYRAGWTPGTPNPANDAVPWYWLAARYYDPRLQRFLQPDPSSQDGVRSYVYCHDDPVNYSDPSGLDEGDGDGEAGGGAGGGAGGAGAAEGVTPSTALVSSSAADGATQPPLFDLGEAVAPASNVEQYGQQGVNLDELTPEQAGTFRLRFNGRAVPLSQLANFVQRARALAYFSKKLYALYGEDASGLTFTANDLSNGERLVTLNSTKFKSNTRIATELQTILTDDIEVLNSTLAAKEPDNATFSNSGDVHAEEVANAVADARGVNIDVMGLSNLNGPCPRCTDLLSGVGIPVAWFGFKL